MCHLKHRLGIFLFRRKIILRSLDIQVFVFLIHPMIYQIRDATMSIST